jgi:pantoate--beta-alanine ligase
MRIVKSIVEMQRLAKSWQGRGVRVGLVPTMGYLHLGHLSLVRRARRLVGKSGKVVVSVYVNPTQFGPKEDFSRYPRDFARDAKRCRNESVDVLFAPSNEEMYPGTIEGKYSTYVIEEQLSQGMEGASRPTHFRGVTTIVAKLFNIVSPSVAVFGAKDYQQAAVVKRMVRDLNFPLKIELAPIFREPDGLAMSSRNKYLAGNLRDQAVVLSRAIKKVQSAVRENSLPVRSAKLKSELSKFIQQQPAARLDYVEFFDPHTLLPLRTVSRGAHMALAVFIGKTRLVDNGPL